VFLKVSQSVFYHESTPPEEKDHGNHGKLGDLGERGRSDWTWFPRAGSERKVETIVCEREEDRAGWMDARKNSGLGWRHFDEVEIEIEKKREEK
jgi:hypothetical protein